jgi:phosphoadenosine phosphosulfate reductase
MLSFFPLYCLLVLRRITVAKIYNVFIRSERAYFITRKLRSIVTQFNLEVANQELAKKNALERMAYGIEQFGQGAVLLSSMQKTASVLMHFFYKLGAENDIVFVDTGFHFHETLSLRDEFMRCYKLNIMTLYPDQTPEQQEAEYSCKLYQTESGQPMCCALRKADPFIEYMNQQGRRLAFGGLRLEEGKARANLDILSKDPRFGGYRLNPILDWSEEMVDEYLLEHEIPTHPLHFEGYPSVGCQCCTTAVKAGEDARAGRWRHLRDEGEGGPIYCDLNFSDGSGI